MLTINHLNGWFTSPSLTRDDPTEIQVLHDVSLSISAGETVALVGESGSGKSVTALSILRLLEEGGSFRLDGSIGFENHALLELHLDEIRKIRGNRISMIFQEPMTSLNPVYTIGNQLLEPLRLHRGLNNKEAEDEALYLLERTGIDEPRNRLRSFPHQLSGGQRQRVMIAMALACRPQLLIADEPTTALDVSTQAQILELIHDVQQEFSMALLLITHDLQLVGKIAERIYIMKDGRIVEEGQASQILTTPENPYTRQLLAAVPRARTSYNQGSEVLLTAKGLSCRFKVHRGWKNLVQKDYQIIDSVANVSFEIRRGTTCGVIGESGSGKTTLGLALLKLVQSSGAIIYNGADLQTLSRKEMRQLRSRIQVVFQDPFSSLSPRMTVGEIVEEGLRVHKKELGKDQRRQFVQEALAEVGLDGGAISRYPYEFSGGQRQRIALARVLILKPELLILDEPTSALDMTIQAQLIALLNKIQKSYNITYLFISHDLKVIRALADYLIVMHNGSIVEAGPAQDTFTHPQHQYTQKLFEAALKTIER
jgi:microcin C transport system ATP-binding protein